MPGDRDEPVPFPASLPDDEPIVRFLDGLGQVLARAGSMQPEQLKAAVEGVLKGHPLPPAVPGLSPGEQAAALMEQAWANPGPGTRMALDALRLDANNTDAWVYLGYDAGDELELALVFFTLALLAGHETLGDAMFEEHFGEFWQIEETQPYMRALEAVARTNWDLGEREGAAMYFAEMLNLNPADEQGARYPLLWVSFERGDHETVRQLLEAFSGDPMAPMTFARALLAFRVAGPDAPESHAALTAILLSQREAAEYLAGTRQLPSPDSPLADAMDESVMFVPMMVEAWEQTPGAREWLKHALEGPPAAVAPDAGPAIPKPSAKEKRSGPRSLD